MEPKEVETELKKSGHAHGPSATSACGLRETRREIREMTITPTTKHQVIPLSIPKDKTQRESVLRFCEL